MVPIPNGESPLTLKNLEYQKKLLETTSRYRQIPASIINILTCPCWCIPCIASSFSDSLADRFLLTTADFPENKCDIYWGCRDVRLFVATSSEEESIAQFLTPPERQQFEMVNQMIQSQERVKSGQDEDE